MAVDERTMFEIYRESDYNRKYHCIYYTELDEHIREREIAKATSGETIFTGFLADITKEQARNEIEKIVDQLNALDEDEPDTDHLHIPRRLAQYLAPHTSG